MNLTDALSMAMPEVIVACATLVLIVVGAIGGTRSTTLVSGLSAASLIAAALVSAFAAQRGEAFGGSFISDAVAAYSKVALYGMSAIAILLGQGWMNRLKEPQFEYPLLVLLAALGMGVMVSAGDLISLYMGVELHSLALYVMAAFRRDDAKSSEAGLKYFVLGALASGLLLYGASLIYGFAGSTRYDVIAESVIGGAGPGIVFGLVFLICGLAFKVSAAPFHMWTPDVYEGAPTPVVAFFTAAPKLAAMIMFTRVLYDAFPGAVDQWRQVIIIIALISVVVGALGGLVQSNVKRLLAYSSIANMGYALIGLAAGNGDGAQAVIIFMTLYMFDATGFFAALTALSRKKKPMENLNDFAGLSRTNMGLAVVLTLLAFSVTGIPPLPGFWGKFYVFKAALNAGLWPVAVAGLVASVVAAFYYLRLVKLMWFDKSPGKVDATPADARAVAFASAIFALPLAMIALAWIEPWAAAAAQSFALQ